MPCYTLSQLLMGTALVAILLGFTQTEGCGTRYMMIESLSFMPDGSRIVVTKLACRDARTPFKFYKANVSRTISWLDISEGNRHGIIDQDFKPGNCGPAFHLWRIGRTPTLPNPSTAHVTMSAFGGGDVTCGVDSEKPVIMPFQRPVSSIAYSPSGRFLAASGMDEVTVLDTRNETVATRVPTIDLPFLSASLMSFTTDDTRIVVADSSAVFVWDLAASRPVSTVFRGLEPRINAIAVAPDNTLIVCSDRWVRRYEFGGKVVATLCDNGGYLCSVSARGNRLAVCGEDQLTIYDLSSNSVLRSLWFPHATALALSAAGDQLAAGDYNGGVALISTKTGVQRSCSNPPGRHRWPWTLPAVFLVGWLVCVALRLSRRTARRSERATSVDHLVVEEGR